MGLAGAFCAIGLLVSCGQVQPRSAEQSAEQDGQRFVTPYESAVYINDCTARQGLVVDAEIDEYGGQSGELIGVDLEWADEVIEGCIAEAEEAGMMYNPVATPELTSAFYDFLLDVAACLEEEGYEVDQPVSRDLFVESRGQAWHPYDAIRNSGLSPVSINQIQEICPSVAKTLEP